MVNRKPTRWLASLLALSTLTLAGCGKEPRPPAPELKATVQAEVESLIERHFPLLQQATITLAGLDGRSVFLATDIVPESLLQGPRIYRLRLNPALTADPPEHSALQAILVHELHHFNDYQQMDLGELLGLYWNSHFNQTASTTYERKTDEKTMALGYAKGLRAYREWLYPRLNVEDLYNKRRDYYTPEEIDIWIGQSLK